MPDKHSPKIPTHIEIEHEDKAPDFSQAQLDWIAKHYTAKSEEEELKAPEVPKEVSSAAPQPVNGSGSTRKEAEKKSSNYKGKQAIDADLVQTEVNMVTVPIEKLADTFARAWAKTKVSARGSLMPEPAITRDERSQKMTTPMSKDEFQKIVDAACAFEHYVKSSESPEKKGDVLQARNELIAAQRGKNGDTSNFMGDEEVAKLRNLSRSVVALRRAMDGTSERAVKNAYANLLESRDALKAYQKDYIIKNTPDFGTTRPADRPKEHTRNV